MTVQSIRTLAEKGLISAYWLAQYNKATGGVPTEDAQTSPTTTPTMVATQQSDALCENNVRLHSLSASTDRPLRRLKADECCSYCDIYNVDMMTPADKERMSEWRKDVNEKLHNSPKTPLATSAKKKKKKVAEEKLKFLKYAPPGVPDEEHGFRWLPSIPPKLNENRPSSSFSPRPTNRPMFLAVSPLDSARKDIEPSLPKRSMSNELLNVITIDDAKLRHQPPPPPPPPPPIIEISEPLRPISQPAISEAKTTTNRGIDGLLSKCSSAPTAFSMPANGLKESTNFRRLNTKLRRIMERDIIEPFTDKMLRRKADKLERGPLSRMASRGPPPCTPASRSEFLEMLMEIDESDQHMV